MSGDWRPRTYWLGVAGLSLAMAALGELQGSPPGLHWTARAVYNAFQLAASVVVGGGIALLGHRWAKRNGGPGFAKPVMAAWWWTLAVSLPVLIQAIRGL